MATSDSSYRGRAKVVEQLPVPSAAEIISRLPLDANQQRYVLGRILDPQTADRLGCRDAPLPTTPMSTLPPLTPMVAQPSSAALPAPLPDAADSPLPPPPPLQREETKCFQSDSEDPELDPP